ncbi:Bacteriophage lambda NinG, partial [uncultured Caudovirales phage]
SDASHYYSAGKHNNLRFNEDNVWLSCRRCNYYMSGNLIPYRERLIKKIGLERVEKLDELSKVKITKNDRFIYIEILTKYK